jgi:hypothetical protein
MSARRPCESTANPLLKVPRHAQVNAVLRCVHLDSSLAAGSSPRIPIDPELMQDGNA